MRVTVTANFSASNPPWQSSKAADGTDDADTGVCRTDRCARREAERRIRDRHGRRRPAESVERRVPPRRQDAYHRASRPAACAWHRRQVVGAADRPAGGIRAIRSRLVGGHGSRDLVRLTLNGDRITGEERLLKDLQPKPEAIRDVRTGPDGAIYILTASATGRLLKLIPKK